MKILTHWLRSYLPPLPVSDTQLAEDLTLRGIAVEGVFPLENGSLFDTDITTNRVDAMNHYGIAREAAAIYNVPLVPLEISLPLAGPGEFPVQIHPDARDLCGRFTAQVIRDVHPGISAGLVSDYFTALGQKQISGAVDITNFVLLGMGQPTHAFDLDKIVGGITVRCARSGEQIKLLDGTTRTLVADDLVIADDVKALSLAGVMGGFDSMITAETRNILVESAWFSPAAIRASSRRHLIHTDASHRFERGADFAAAPVANALVTRHILAYCGGRLDGGLVDFIVPEHRTATQSRPPITLSVANVQHLLGTTLAPEGITAALIARYLTALGCLLEARDEGEFAVHLPSWRLDLSREIDLIEEIARVYGYNGFANTLPTPGVVVAHPLPAKEDAVRTRLFELGFSEAISSSFASAAESEFFAKGSPAILLENPLSEEAANLRPSLLPGMATMLAGNLNRDTLHVRLFELGAIFSGSAHQVEERASLSLGLTGEPAFTPPHALEAPLFFELKGAIESLLTLFRLDSVPVYTPFAGSKVFEPGRAASVTLGPGRQTLAVFGQLSMFEANRRKLRQPIYLAELNLAVLLTLPLRRTSATAQELSRFQAVGRDFSFTFPDSVLWAQMEAAIRASAPPELRSLAVVEVWRDRKKYPGVFSILIRTAFQSGERTLVDRELATWSDVIITALQSLGGTLRT